jgi:hypothetical protein
MIALGRLTASSRPVSIAIKGCILNNNHSRDHPRSAAEIIIGSNMDNPVKGEVVFDQCVIENSNWGIFYSRKREDAYSVTFKDCTAKNICKDGSWPPVFLEVPNYRQPRGSLGGYFFDNLYLEYGTDVPFMVVQGSRLGTLKKVKNIKGTVTIMGLEYEDFNYINYNPESNEGVELEITRKFH